MTYANELENCLDESIKTHASLLEILHSLPEDIPQKALLQKVIRPIQSCLVGVCLSAWYVMSAGP